MLKLRTLLCLLAVFTLGIFDVANVPQAFASSSTSKTFIPFSTFLNGVENAHYQDFAVQSSGHVVQSERAFAEMRSYILTMYAGVQPVNSYILDGQYFDCITVNEQPTVRLLHITKLASPPKVVSATQGSAQNSNATSPLTLGQKDAFGHSIACADGTIPMERITLERLSKFPTLKAFLAKGPDGQGVAASTIQPGGSHRYGVSYQSVNNYGGSSRLNLWNPSGDFSLSQEWYVGGSGDNTQTAEGGWVHYPQKFGSQSVLFIYFTPDNYKVGGPGCYNLECPGFVQTNKSWAFGGKFSSYSTYGGVQYEFMLQWQYYQGNWWLLLQGGGNAQFVGYYPGSVYNHGQMASHAQIAEYGGETYTGGTNWPQMGSGKFASAGWQQAAFQRRAFYITTSSAGVWSTLSPIQTNPACYTIDITPSSNGGNWGTYFFFGGAGGNC